MRMAQAVPRYLLLAIVACLLGCAAATTAARKRPSAASGALTSVKVSATAGKLAGRSDLV